jgi:hypothetical protein
LFAVGANGIMLKSTDGGGPLLSSPAEPATPIRPDLSQNYPNPFNPGTTISFSILHASFVTLTVYDVLGREAATLVNRTMEPGTYDAGFAGAGLPSGLYFYRLTAGPFTETRKMLLLR